MFALRSLSARFALPTGGGFDSSLSLHRLCSSSRELVLVCGLPLAVSSGERYLLKPLRIENAFNHHLQFRSLPSSATRAVGRDTRQDPLT